jgi:hypothetical protein
MNRSRVGLLFAASRSIDIKDIQGKAKEMQRTTNGMDLQCLSPVDTRQLQYQPHHVRRAVPVLERVERLAAYIMLYMLIVIETTWNISTAPTYGPCCTHIWLMNDEHIYMHDPRPHTGFLVRACKVQYNSKKKKKGLNDRYSAGSDVMSSVSTT